MSAQVEQATLLPCPFCGMELRANTNQADLYVRRYGTHYTHPDNPGCFLDDSEVSPRQVEEWNRRTLAAEASCARDATYRMLQRGDVIEAADEFLQDDGVTWVRDPHSIFLGCEYSSALKPARRGIAEVSARAAGPMGEQP